MTIKEAINFYTNIGRYDLIPTIKSRKLGCIYQNADDVVDEITKRRIEVMKKK